jgi:uncharacterized flavoprotein (TIGR03862 family)
MPAAPDLLVVGGGPAGLRAAEVVAAAGRRVIVADRMPSMGRKFLVAGRGGLNLTHSEPLEKFCARYGGDAARFRRLLADFNPAEVRAWAKELGIETFVGTSGRVFPESKQAAPLLRRWIARLRALGVEFNTRHRLLEISKTTARFETPAGVVEIEARAIVLALGGAAWPQTGSDGAWTSLFARAGMAIEPLTASNCGYEVDWPADFLARAEGRPLKNISVRAGRETVAGELLITRYGLEGGALYQLGPALRAMSPPQLVLDLKPTFSTDELAAKLTSVDPAQAARRWKLSPAAAALLELGPAARSPAELAARAKALPLTLRGPRPLAEAISTAGGVAWSELDDHLMLRSRPGVFCAGEMIAWDAPTGGYLLQGCLATGTAAGRGALAFLGEKVPS